MHFLQKQAVQASQGCLMHTKKANNGRRCRSQKKSDSILLSFFDKKSNKKHMNFASRSEGRQDRVRPRFLIKLDMKPRMHLVEISIFSLNLVIVRPTKIMNRADKIRPQFQEIKYLKNQKFQKQFLIKVGLLVKYCSEKFLFGKI